jgi:hypothetical protein
MWRTRSCTIALGSVALAVFAAGEVFRLGPNTPSAGTDSATNHNRFAGSAA